MFNSYSNPDKALAEACRMGHKDLALSAIQKGAVNLNWGLAEACGSGQKGMVMLMIDKGADDWERGLINACLGGQKELILLMIDKGATNCDEGLGYIVHKGYKELILLMIEKCSRLEGNYDYSLELTDIELEYLIKKNIIIDIRSKYFEDSKRILEKTVGISQRMSYFLPDDLVKLCAVY